MEARVVAERSNIAVMDAWMGMSLENSASVFATVGAEWLSVVKAVMSTVAS